MALIVHNNTDVSDTENRRVIESHKNTGSYLILAATHHFKAASYLKKRNHEKATKFDLLSILSCPITKLK